MAFAASNKCGVDETWSEREAIVSKRELMIARGRWIDNGQLKRVVLIEDGWAGSLRSDDVGPCDDGGFRKGNPNCDVTRNMNRPNKPRARI